MPTSIPPGALAALDQAAAQAREHLDGIIEAAAGMVAESGPDRTVAIVGYNTTIEIEPDVAATALGYALVRLAGIPAGHPFADPTTEGISVGVDALLVDVRAALDAGEDANVVAFRAALDAGLQLHHVVAYGLACAVVRLAVGGAA